MQDHGLAHVKNGHAPVNLEGAWSSMLKPRALRTASTRTGGDFVLMVVSTGAAKPSAAMNSTFRNALAIPLCGYSDECPNEAPSPRHHRWHLETDTFGAYAGYGAPTQIGL